ncbi:MAG: AEC family transporter [Ruminococcaceae bacterium]|nr:AEC family transporter [Oscillospiraceae bacterium]
MEMSLIIMRKIVMMFILVLIGYICARVGMIDAQTNKRLSSLSLKLVTPMLILSSYQTDFSDHIIRNLGLSFILAIVGFAVQIPLGIFLIRKKNNPDYQIERLSLIFANCGYFGIPLVESLYGAEGAIYITAAITLFNLLIWTVGDAIMSGKVSLKSILCGMMTPVSASVVLGAVLLLLRIRLPELIMEPVRSVAAMNTPFAMIVAGATLAGTNVFACLKDRRIYWVMLCKMLLIPACAAIVLTRIPMEPMLVLIPVLTAASPTAAACPMFAVLYDKNAPYASQMFGVTTLVSIVTIPLIFTLATVLM